MDTPSTQEINRLEKIARRVRQEVIMMLQEAGSGHPAGSLGLADILTALYFQILRHDPLNPDASDRDRFILSNGHVCPALYAVLALSGYFPKERLTDLRQLNSPLQGHPHRVDLPGLETTSGPLGSGLSQACGMAYIGKLDHKIWRVVCLMSDGEQDEGNTWEAVIFAAKYKLDNLTAVIDRNNIQIDGFTENVMPLEPLKDKYLAFGWHVLEIDGHDFGKIIKAFKEARRSPGKPTVIIASTISGKGVSFMEGKPEWHGKTPDRKETGKALEDLNYD